MLILDLRPMQKYLYIFLLFPLLGLSQTVHFRSMEYEFSTDNGFITHCLDSGLCMKGQNLITTLNSVETLKSLTTYLKSKKNWKKLRSKSNYSSDQHNNFFSKDQIIVTPISETGSYVKE